MGKNESSTFAIKKSGLSSKVRGLFSTRLSFCRKSGLTSFRFYHHARRMRGAPPPHILEQNSKVVAARARAAHTYQTVSHDSIQILLILQIGRNIIHACAHDKDFLSQPKVAQKNQGPLNRTVIQNNGKNLTAPRRRSSAAAPRACKNLPLHHSAQAHTAKVNKVHTPLSKQIQNTTFKYCCHVHT